LNRIYNILFSETTKDKVEKGILYLAIFSFICHLILIYVSEWNLHDEWTKGALFKNPISAIYTPFSFILIYEVYLLIYYVPKSFTTYIIKQYEIITLIIIRKLFKDLASLELTTQWFEIKDDLQFTFDILASLILFFLIFQFQKEGSRTRANEFTPGPSLLKFIHRKKIIAIVLIPLFLGLALVTFSNWFIALQQTPGKVTAFESINNLFFDEFFTILIMVDVVLLLLSFFYTNKFHIVMRNSGFIVSTILIRLSFGVEGLISTVLVVMAVVFGLFIIIIHNKFEKYGHRLTYIE